jgi:hypothetical protein
VAVVSFSGQEEVLGRDLSLSEAISLWSQAIRLTDGSGSAPDRATEGDAKVDNSLGDRKNIEAWQVAGDDRLRSTGGNP